MDEYWLDEAVFTAQQRSELAKQGLALPDGSFPIVTKAHLVDAIKALGLAKDQAAAKRHIIKRARALGAVDMLPAAWGVREAQEDDAGEQLAEAEAGSFLRPVVEADGAEPDGSRWDVVVIRVGRSQNGRRYSEAVLRQAAPLFEGARVLARSDEDHIAGRNTSVANVVGWIEGVRYEAKALRATLNIVDPGLRAKLLEAWNRGKRDLMGLSIVAEGTGRTVVEGGEQVMQVESITRVGSVDLVLNPAAGGGLIRLVAAEGEEEEPMLQQLIERLREAENTAVGQMIRGVAEMIGYSTDELLKMLVEQAPELEGKITEAMTAPPSSEPRADQGPENPPPPDPEDLIPVGLSRMVVRAELAETRLPETSRARIDRRFSGRSFRALELTEAIRDELELWSELERQGLVRSSGQPRAEVGLEEADRGIAALTGFFLGEDALVEGERIPRYRSFRDAYVELTGDTQVSGRLPERPSGRLGVSEADGGRFRVHQLVEADGGGFTLSEAVSTTQFDQTLADSVTRAMVREYNRSNLMIWKILADVVPVRDFRLQHRVRIGGYGNLPPVAQGAAYTPLTSPADEEATYAATKRGGTESITLEAIANDDITAIKRVPMRLARAAAQTLHEFVLELVNPATNANIYDGTALYLAGHNNLGVVALSVSSLSAALGRMRKQTEAGSLKRLGLVGRHLWVPVELEQLAHELTMSAQKPGTADNDANFVRSKGIDYEVVDYWTDTNNWVLSADMADVPIIEVGFYGSEEPELFTQDMPNVGSMFSNDQTTLKIRHIYGSAVVDFRGLDGSIVP